MRRSGFNQLLYVNMETIAVLLFVALVSVAQSQVVAEDLGQFGETEKSCVKKLNLDEFMVDYNLKQLYMPENNIQFNKFMACVWKKDGFIDAKDNLVFDTFKEFIAETFAEAVGTTRIAEAFARDSVNSCKSVKGDTAGQTGIKFMNCVTRLSQH